MSHTYRVDGHRLAIRNRRAWLLLTVVVLVAAVVAVTKLASGPSSASTAHTVGIYTGSEVPPILSEDDERSVELGTVFHVTAPGQVVALRFYQSSQNTGSHTGALWTASGTKLASVKFKSSGKAGFQTAILSTPQSLSPNTDYVVSYHASEGHYSEQQWSFSGGATIGASNVVRATSGVYVYSRSTSFPATTWHDSSYYVDVLFAASGPSVPSSSSAAPSSVVPTKSATPTKSSKPTKSSPPATSSHPPVSSSSVPSRPAPSTSASAPSPTSSAPPSPVGGSGGGTAGVPAGTVLRAVPAQLTSGTGWKWDGSGVQVTGANAVLTGLDINGSIHGSVNGLVITDSKIRCTGEAQWCISLGSNSRIVSTEIGGGANGSTFVAAIGVFSGGSGANNVLDRVDIHHTSDGMRIDGGTTLTNSYIHDLSMGDIAGAHSDGIQSTGGSNVIVANNRIETGNNCNVFLQWLSGNSAISSYKIVGNTFVAGNRNGEQTSYGVCAYSPDVSGVTITGNTFSRGYQVGPFTAPSGSTISGNVYSDGTKIG